MPFRSYFLPAAPPLPEPPCCTPDPVFGPPALALWAAADWAWAGKPPELISPPLLA